MLWDDGEVTKVPYYDVLYAKVKTREGYRQIYPGQAGTYSEVLTYDQYHQKVFGMKRGPRGKDGTGGEVLDDLVAKAK